MNRAPRVVWVPPEDIDAEVVDLCRAINTIPGVQTIESCFGHGRERTRIFLHTETVERLLPLLYAATSCHNGCGTWRVEIYTDCSGDKVRYMLESPGIGEEAVKQIAALKSVLSPPVKRGKGKRR